MKGQIACGKFGASIVINSCNKAQVCVYVLMKNLYKTFSRIKSLLWLSIQQREAYRPVMIVLLHVASNVASRKQ